MKRLIAVLLFATLAFAVSQRDIEAPETLPDADAATFQMNPETNTMFPYENVLQLIYDCSQAGSSIVDVGGVQHFRVYGFDFVSDLEYSASGPRAFSPALQRAQTRAMGSAAEFLLGFSAYVSRELSESTERASSEAAASTNGERVETASVSTASSEVLERVYRTQSTGFIVGGKPSGTSFTSLGGDFGYCVVARYDIPLAAEEEPEVAPDDAASVGSDVASEDNSGVNYEPLPPGTIGDF